MVDIKLSSLRRYMLEQELMFLAGQPVVYHCHHFNLFLDQTIDDALGFEESRKLRTKAAQEFSYQLLSGICAKADAETPAERIQVAAEVFRLMGHGTLDVDADQAGGQASGAFLHYGYTWNEKYGERVRRKHPADAFASGFAAAAVECAFGLEHGAIKSEETSCLATRASACQFELSPSAAPTSVGKLVGEAESRVSLAEPEDGINEDIIQPIAAGLKEFTAGVAGDERGLIQAFGVFVTMHLAGYYNRISYDAIAAIEKTAPQSVTVLEELLRESGHVCVFNTYGGVLLSPEWEALVGPLTDNPEDIVTWCMAISRAFGFGRWTVAEFIPEKRLVLRTSSSYEAVYYKTRHGVASRPVEYMFQGAALATAQLAHRVKWTEKPKLTPEYYQELFKGGVPWKAVQTRSLVCGDSISEVVVSKE